MEPNFQTSFIPKKPMIEERVSTSRPFGIWMVGALFLLFAVVLSAGGLYFYKGLITKQTETMKKDLEVAKNRFEPEKIRQLEVLDRRLIASSEILDKHIAISPIFKALQDLTLKSVRYTRFAYTFDELSTKVIVKMGGVAVGYRSVALQSDLFPKNRNIIDPVFSNLVLDDKGNVLFDLNFTVDPTFVDYNQILKAESNTSISGEAVPPTDIIN